MFYLTKQTQKHRRTEIALGYLLARAGAEWVLTFEKHQTANWSAEWHISSDKLVMHAKNTLKLLWRLIDVDKLKNWSYIIVYTLYVF